MKKILISTEESYKYVNINNILRFEAMGKRTLCVRKDNEDVLIKNSLKTLEELLNTLRFQRIHNSHLINMNYIKEISRGKERVVVMEDGSTILVSHRKRKDFLNRLCII